MVDPESMMERSHQRIDDEISRAAFDLLLKEPFYAHVLAGMPRVLTGEVRSMGLRWNRRQRSASRSSWPASFAFRPSTPGRPGPVLSG